METLACKDWNGAKTPTGYGQKSVGGKVKYIHRIIWEENNGHIPNGLVVRHKCDNPSCYEISHLELGTPKQNTADMMERRRHIAGNTKLTRSQVNEIRARYNLISGVTQLKLAREYGVDQTTISHIISNKSWRGAEI